MGKMLKVSSALPLPQVVSTFEVGFLHKKQENPPQSHKEHKGLFDFFKS